MSQKKQEKHELLEGDQDSDLKVCILGLAPEFRQKVTEGKEVFIPWLYEAD